MHLTVQRTDDIAVCHSLRHEVFVLEQHVTLEEEIDGRDADALHFLAVRDGRAVGTARVLFDGDVAIIGRVCVLKPERGRGTGAEIMRQILADLRAQKNLVRASLGAQLHAIAFYEGLGFHAEGPEFDDAGIPHRWMHIEL